MVICVSSIIVTNEERCVFVICVVLLIWKCYETRARTWRKAQKQRGLLFCLVHKPIESFLRCFWSIIYMLLSCKCGADQMINAIISCFFKCQMVIVVYYDHRYSDRNNCVKCWCASLKCKVETYFTTCTKPREKTLAVEHLPAVCS